MRRPSMFSKDYYKIMKRRRITAGVLIALAIIFASFFILTDGSSYIKEFVKGIKSSQKKQIVDKNTPTPTPAKDKTNDGAIDDKSGKDTKKEEGQYEFNISDGVKISILYTKENEEFKFTGIEPEDKGVFFDIRSDGGAIVFDNPVTSDIYICNANGEIKKISPDFYKQSGKSGDGAKFYKKDIMAKYQNKYIWASKPKFLKDNRIVYQSNLPWFKTENTIYIWVIDSDGNNNKKLFDTKQSQPATYKMADDGKLIVEYGGNKQFVE